MKQEKLFFEEETGLCVTVDIAVADLVKMEMRSHQADRGYGCRQDEFQRAVLSGNVSLVEKAVVFKKRNPNYSLDPNAPDNKDNTLLMQVTVAAFISVAKFSF